MCEARQYSDQMQCGPCGLAWDVNDPDPPICGAELTHRAMRYTDRLFKAAHQARDKLLANGFTESDLDMLRVAVEACEEAIEQ